VNSGATNHIVQSLVPFRSSSTVSRERRCTTTSHYVTTSKHITNLVGVINMLSITQFRPEHQNDNKNITQKLQKLWWKSSDFVLSGTRWWYGNAEIRHPS